MQVIRRRALIVEIGMCRAMLWVGSSGLTFVGRVVRSDFFSCGLTLLWMGARGLTLVGEVA